MTGRRPAPGAPLPANGLHRPSDVLLVSTYELGHQPLLLAQAQAALRGAGHRVRCIDLAVEEPRYLLDRAAGTDLVAVAVPMHTAARLAVSLAPRLREAAPDAHVCLFGLYASEIGEASPAAAGAEASVPLADSLLGGEFEPGLVALADAIARRVPGVAPRSVEPPPGGEPAAPVPAFPRQRFLAPDRTGLPPLDRYARCDTGEGLVLAGYVEASRGCAHRCAHCPITPVYGGRLRLVDRGVVLGDAAQQIEAGARHITFGDPDFLNAVPHALAIVDELATRHPGITFDATAKVEHLLEHQDLLPRLRDAGLLFVTSAFESTSDRVLTELEKGHAASDLDRVVETTRRHGVALRPTWVAFTPWGGLEDYLAMLDFVERHGLQGAAPPVQYALRLLLPPGSPLVPRLFADGVLDGFDRARLTYRWRHADARVERLAADVGAIVAAAQASSTACSAHAGRRAALTSASVLGALRDAVAAAAGEARPAGSAGAAPAPFVPGLTEAWFC
ncbi:MAG: radical SAM protein [Chloroflexi bacterium]|nr:radical SAM protein [Chloroflexota bacterium]